MLMLCLINIISLVLFFLSTTPTGATYSGNYALSFDGQSSIVKISHMNTDLFLSNQWTLEAWIKPYGNQANNFQPNIVGFPMRHPNLELCGNSGNPGCPENPTKTLTQLRDQNGNYFTVVSNTAIPDVTNTWYHIAGTWDNVTLIMYRNGQLEGSLQPYSQGYVYPLNCSFTLCDEGIDIGGFRFITPTGQLWNSQYFKGIIDEVRVWNKGRSQADINNNKGTVLTGNEDGLVYYWRFDEGAGLLVNSMALTAYGTLGGGISSTQPQWVQSDSPLSNPYPIPPVPGCPVSSPCNCNEAGVYVAGSILGIVFIIAGMIIGILGYNRVNKRNYENLK